MCSIPRAMVLEILRDQQVQELREELAYYENGGVVSSLSTDEVAESVRFIRDRIAGLQNGTVDPEDGVM